MDTISERSGWKIKDHASKCKPGRKYTQGCKGNRKIRRDLAKNGGQPAIGKRPSRRDHGHGQDVRSNPSFAHQNPILAATVGAACTVTTKRASRQTPREASCNQRRGLEMRLGRIAIDRHHLIAHNIGRGIPMLLGPCTKRRHMRCSSVVL